MKWLKSNWLNLALVAIALGGGAQALVTQAAYFEHRLITVEQHLDKTDAILAKLTENQQLGLQALAKVQQWMEDHRPPPRFQGGPPQ